MTFEEIEKNETIRAYISKADESLVALGYTEHSFAHVTHVAAMAGYLLETLGYDAHTVELAKIAGYLHDIGNLVNRIEHSQSGAVMAFQILTSLGFGAEDVATIVTAIGNHDEGTGVPVNAVAAALILADKADVRNILRRLGVLDGDWIRYPKQELLEYNDDAPCTGCWYPEKKPGDRFRKGEKLGEIRDYFGKSLFTELAPADGVLLYQTASLNIIEKGPMVSYGVPRPDP